MAIAFSLPAHLSTALPFTPNLNTLRCPEIMVELRLPPVPADLKHVLPFLQRAQEVRARDPVVCYWSLYYVARLGMQRGKTPENQAFLAAVVDQLEGMKRSLKTRRQITDEAAGSSYIRRFGYNIYDAAKNEDAQGQATRATAKKFLAASYFLEILRAFGPLDGEVEETIKYAKFKAADIVRLVREGTTPASGIPAAPNANHRTLSPSALSPQSNPILLSGRPSTFHSPAESPTNGAPRRGFTHPQPNYPPPPTESAGSGSAPVSPRHAGGHSPFRTARQDIKPEQVPAAGSSGEVPFPEPTSPRKYQSPVRSPLAVNGTPASLDATPVNRLQPLPNMHKPPSPANPRSYSPVKIVSPAEVFQELSATAAPVIQQPQPQWPPANIVLTRPGEWPQQALVSPAMSSTMTMDSAETFTSSQLRTVVASGSMAVRTAPRVSSPVKTESVASTSQQSDSQVTESVTSEDESVADSELMPMLTVVDDLGKKIEIPTGLETAGLVAVASPVMDDWGFGREMSEAIGRLAAMSPTRTSNTGSSPLSLARNTPIPGSPDAALQTPSSASPPLAPGTRAGPTVVIPQSPAQPSPTTPNMLSPYSPTTVSPVSLDAMAQNQSFKSAAELIDMSFSKVYGKFGDADAADAVLDDDGGMDIEVESGSSGSFTSGDEEDEESEGESEGESEAESQASEKVEEKPQSADGSDGSGSESEGDGSSVVSEMTIMSAQVGVQTKGDEVQQTSGFELKSLIKSNGSNGGTQIEAVVARKSVRFAPSVVGGLSPEIPKQILPPPPPMTPQSRSSPPLQIIPASAVSHSSQPLVRPKSLTIRSNSYDSYRSSSMSPDSPSFSHGIPPRSSGMVGYAQPPPLIDGRPAEEFSIIPFHPSMSASHPPPALHNNPAFGPAPPSIVRTQWNGSPPQAPGIPPRRAQSIDRDTAALAQKYSRFAISSLNYMDVETAKKELRAALSLLEGETY